MPNEDDRFGDVAEQLKQTEDGAEGGKREGEAVTDEGGKGAGEDVRDEGDEADGDDDAVAAEPTASVADAPTQSHDADDGPASTLEAADADEQESGAGEPADGPAFPFDATQMHGFYVRDGTWTRVTRLRSSVTAACSMFDVPEFEGREFQDACLRVVAEHGDEVALQILRERGIEADDERVREVVDMLRD